MLCGIPPFYNDNLERMYELIKLCDLRFPKRVKVSADAQDLIAKVILIILVKIKLFKISCSIKIKVKDLVLKMVWLKLKNIHSLLRWISMKS